MYIHMKNFLLIIHNKAVNEVNAQTAGRNHRQAGFEPIGEQTIPIDLIAHHPYGDSVKNGMEHIEALDGRIRGTFQYRIMQSVEISEKHETETNNIDNDSLLLCEFSVFQQVPQQYEMNVTADCSHIQFPGKFRPGSIRRQNREEKEIQTNNIPQGFRIINKPGKHRQRKIDREECAEKPIDRHNLVVQQQIKHLFETMICGKRDLSCIHFPNGRSCSRQTRE